MTLYLWFVLISSTLLISNYIYIFILQENVIISRIKAKKDRLTRLAFTNELHCNATNPMYGTDLQDLINTKNVKRFNKILFDPLKRFINSNENHYENMDEVLNRLVF